MKQLLKITTAAVLVAGAANAGGIGRTGLGSSILFKDGNFVKFGMSRVSPEVNGDYSAGIAGFTGVSTTSDMASDYNSFSFAYKHEINDKWDVAFLVYDPYGANASYSQGFYTGLGAEWNSTAFVALAKYQVNEAFSVYGGAKVLQTEANIQIPGTLFTGGYTAVGDKSTDLGFVLGAAYERPELGLRIAVTYESSIDQSFRTTETTALGTTIGTTEVEAPQSLRIEYQSGISKNLPNTGVFASVTWTEWSVWQVSPPTFAAATIPLGGDGNVVSFDNNVLAWEIGAGHKFNSNWTGFASLSYEKSNGGTASRLSPTDGRKGVAIGARYKNDKVEITGGFNYTKLGGATVSPTTGTSFDGSDSIGFGMSIGFYL